MTDSELKIHALKLAVQHCVSDPAANVTNVAAAFYVFLKGNPTLTEPNVPTEEKEP